LPQELNPLHNQLELGEIRIGTLDRRRTFREQNGLGMHEGGHMGQNAVLPFEHGFAGAGFADDEDLKPENAPWPIRAEGSVLRSDRFKGEPLQEFDGIIGSSTPLTEMLDLVRVVAPTSSTVLIEGETGTGKELIARAIHNISPRRRRPFVKLNCAAIPFDLLESELFGHEKGAFTGAIAQRIGRFEVANGGTIFLDEIGEIPLELQTKLLRVLQEKEFERLGSSRTLRTDARLIAATNRDLEAMVGEQKFRADLFFRLNVFPIHVPPLRERPEDIPLLVQHFTQQFSKRMNKALDAVPSSTMDALCRYHWPGNIRELQNVIERAVILTRGNLLEVPLGEPRKANTNKSTDAVPPEHEFTVRENTDWRNARNEVAEEYAKKQREEIVRTLSACKGRVGGADGAAARMVMNRTTLLSRMKKFGIYAKEYS
jgi:formate hydrogenlyase transcriptional activator